MARKRQPRREKLFNNYMDLKRELGRRPTYLELHLKGASDSPQFKQEFNSYVGFLKWGEELTNFEMGIKFLQTSKLRILFKTFNLA